MCVGVLVGRGLVSVWLYVKLSYGEGTDMCVSWWWRMQLWHRRMTWCLRDGEGRGRSGLIPRLLEPGNETEVEGGT